MSSLSVNVLRTSYRKVLANYTKLLGAAYGFFFTGLLMLFGGGAAANAGSGLLSKLLTGLIMGLGFLLALSAFLLGTFISIVLICNLKKSYKEGHLGKTLLFITLSLPFLWHLKVLIDNIF